MTDPACVAEGFCNDFAPEAFAAGGGLHQFAVDQRQRRKRMPEPAGNSGLQASRRALRERQRRAAMLANALIGLAFATPDGFRTVREELTRARHRAVELGPTNPRVVLMDAGMVFGTPETAGGSKERGLQRWLQAIDLFESEVAHAATNPLAPRWGRALAYGWLCQLYLAATPPRTAEAKKAAASALSLRPDFWYVRERILRDSGSDGASGQTASGAPPSARPRRSAAGQSVVLHVGALEYTLRQPLQLMLASLPSRSFVQIHRSHAVNLSHVKELVRLGKGDAQVVLTTGAQLRLSRRYRGHLRLQLGWPI